MDCRQMQADFLFSEPDNTSNELIETFGRGAFPKHPQHRFTHRDGPEPLSLLHPTSENRPYPREKQLITFRQSEERKDSTRLKQQSSRAQLAHIDQINDKISGLIKSISASCQKKVPIELDSKRRTGLEDSGQYDGRGKLDSQKTEKKKSLPYGELYPLSKPSFFEARQEKRDRQWAQRPNKPQVRDSFDEEQYDQLNERIKKISTKIDQYQRKTRPDSKGSQAGRELRQISNFIGRTPKRQARDITQLKEEIRAQGSNFSKIQKENADRVQDKQALFNKRGYFNGKFKEMQKEEKSYKNEGSQWQKPSQQKEKQLQVNKLSKMGEGFKINSKMQEILAYKTTFVKALVKQIGLDQDFRHAKHMFGGIQGLNEDHHSSQKWARLQSELRKQGFNLSLPQVREIFMPRDDEIDPFMSVTHCHEQLIHGVIFAYQASERHWNESIYHNWTLWQLKQSKFTSQYLDRGRKGSITLQDLTFYINTEIDANYRNRDLLLIFNRLSSQRSKHREETDAGIRYKEVVDRLLSL